MTLKEAIDLLLNKHHLEDWIYEVRERIREETLGETWTSSWEHPDVKEFAEICGTLQCWLEVQRQHTTADI